MIRISRRRFLSLGAGATVLTGGAVAAAHGLRAHPAAGSAPSTTPGSAPGAAASPTTQPTTAPAPGAHSTTTPLVLVALYGGNDGLNTLIPYNDSAYLDGRPELGYKPSDVIPLDSTLALNSSLTGMKSLWDAKRLAIVRGVGYPNPNYSHFRSMDIWQSGVPDTVETSGWLGRWLDTLGKDPLTALALGTTLPKLLQGNMTAGAAIPTSALTLPHADRIEQPFAALESPVAGEPDLFARVAQSGKDLLTVLHAVRDILGTNAPPSAGSMSPLARELDMVARLIKGGLPTRVYVVSQQGFDTHVDEKLAHQRLLGELDAAFTGFVHTMGSQPVVVMTFSEFGRRVAQNASGGTDHGSAAPLFVAGPTVTGGFYSEEPSLTDLDNGNLKFTTDFRSVYSTLLARVLGADPASALRGRFPEVPFV